MAGCYHDKEDYKSDLSIEVAREGDMLQEGQELKNIKCNKNPGHRDFIPFKDLALEHLPIEDRNREILDMIKNIGSVVVRLVVGKIKNGRRIKEAGSGCLTKTKKGYLIRTNNHVVKTEDDVKNCTVEFHYDYNDDDSRSRVKTTKGEELVYTCPYRDFTVFTFHPVPDFVYKLDWVYDRITSIVIMEKDNQILTVEIYPYKICNTSQVQFSSPANLNSPTIELMFISWPDGSIGYLQSFYFKFQPIPSNIHQLTSLEVHINEDDGNGRVIPGDVVKFYDEYVVKISESIFQDKVKKCRVVWKGEVIGRGTRLYFQQVKASDIYSGIDLERDTNLGREYYCILEFNPLPRFVEAKLNRSNIMCCIGHPHGGPKMVTFGRFLDISPEQFDNQYRRISQPNPNSQCHVVSCMKYSCKTCPGSSGSPVFRLLEEMDWRNSSIHFMGEKVKIVLPNGVLIENINIAWAPYSGV